MPAERTTRGVADAGEGLASLAGRSYPPAPPLKSHLYTVHRRPAWQRYGAAVILAVCVVAARIALDPVWGYQHNRHLLFLPMVLLAAWLGGFGPGLAATLIASIALDYFWTQPRHTLFEHALAPDLLLFFVVSLVVCALIESLHAARARADAATAARERLLAIVAHDLRNPLGTMQLASAALQRAAADGPLAADVVRARLAPADRAVARMERLIQDLVDTTHIERGALRVDLREERLEPLVRDVAEVFVPLARDKGVAFEAGPTPDTVIRADRNRLVQVLGNLIGNALKFTPAGGRVGLRTREEVRSILFEVEDNGPGIKPEDLSHVFEPYWRSDGGGTGLGLFIARSIVREHGGRLDVRSQPGRGATFSFHIARVPGSAPTSQPKAAAPRAGPTPEA